MFNLYRQLRKERKTSLENEETIKKEQIALKHISTTLK